MNRELSEFVRGLGEEWQHYGVVPWLAGKVVIAEVAVFFAAVIAFALRPRKHDGRAHDWAVGLLLGVAAFALRWWLPVHSLLHENRHGYGFSPSNPLRVVVQSHRVASAHLTLYGLFHRVTPWPTESMFQMNALLSAVAVGGVWFFAKEVFSSRLIAWTCACLLLFQPLAIMLAPTEEFMVSATGLCMAGMALLTAGVRRDDHRLLTAGIALMCLTASAREVALPLAALAPVVLLAASDRARPIPWNTIAAATFAMGVALLPQLLNILDARAEDPHSHTLIGMPHLPFIPNHLHRRDMHWVGWQQPYMPTWMGALIVVSVPALCVYAYRKRDARPALGGVLTVVIAQLQGGLAGAGWFPSNMRHQHLAMAMAMLPAGWLLGSALEWLGARAPRWSRASWAAAPLIGALTLAVVPSGYRVKLPMSEEYLFLRQALGAIPPGARLYYFDHPTLGYGSVLASWFQNNTRDLEVRTVGQIAERRSESRARPSFLLIDRSCFLNAACFDGRTPVQCFQSAVRAAQPLVPSRFGRMTSVCRDALQAAPWREVMGRDLRTPHPNDHFYYDIPSADDRVRISLLAMQPDGP